MKELDEYLKARYTLLTSFNISTDYDFEDGRKNVWYLQKGMILWAASKEALANGRYYTSEAKAVYKTDEFTAIVVNNQTFSDDYARVFDNNKILTKSEVAEYWDY